MTRDEEREEVCSKIRVLELMMEFLPLGSDGLMLKVLKSLS